MMEVLVLASGKTEGCNREANVKIGNGMFCDKYISDMDGEIILDVPFGEQKYLDISRRFIICLTGMNGEFTASQNESLKWVLKKLKEEKGVMKIVLETDFFDNINKELFVMDEKTRKILEFKLNKGLL